MGKVTAGWAVDQAVKTQPSTLDRSGVDARSALAVVLTCARLPDRMFCRCVAEAGRRDVGGAVICAQSWGGDGRARLVMAVRSSSLPFPFGSAVPE